MRLPEINISRKRLQIHRDFIFKNMMILSALFLIVLIVGVSFGETADRPFHTSRVTGKDINLAPTEHQWTQSLPCLDQMLTTWRMKQKPIYAILCRKKKSFPAGQPWSSELTLPSRIMPVPEGTFLVEREKDLSTYNWNSFGLRYGKREYGTINSKLKTW